MYTLYTIYLYRFVFFNCVITCNGDSKAKGIRVRRVYWRWISNSESKMQHLSYHSFRSPLKVWIISYVLNAIRCPQSWVLLFFFVVITLCMNNISFPFLPLLCTGRVRCHDSFGLSFMKLWNKTVIKLLWSPIRLRAWNQTAGREVTWCAICLSLFAFNYWLVINECNRMCIWDNVLMWKVFCHH